MAKASGKPGSKKCLVLGFCIGLLAVAFIADFLWASSSSSSSMYITSNWSVDKPIGRIVPKIEKKVEATKDHKAPNTDGVNATFADLPAPQLQWEEMAEAPVPRLDGAAIQIKNLLYVFAGYGTIDYVHSHVDIYNFTDNTWGGRFDMPKEMAHSHLGMATDGRYIYVVTGQYGPQCRGPTARNFVLDTETKQWRDLPPLPVPRVPVYDAEIRLGYDKDTPWTQQGHRFYTLKVKYQTRYVAHFEISEHHRCQLYAPATQLWRGRLHVMGGSKEDRHEPALEHWSLAVKNGNALEKEWRPEIPIPRGGPHRACVVVNDRLLAIGGQEGDFMAKPGSPIFKCARRSEVVYSDVYMLDDEMKWKQLPPMPKPDSHIEFAWVIVNNSLIIAGGTTEKHPVTKKMVLVGELLLFHLDTLEWSVLGKMPFRIKTTLVGFWNGWLYFTSGQRDRGPNDPSPKKVIGSTWRTKLSL